MPLPAAKTLALLFCLAAMLVPGEPAAAQEQGLVRMDTADASRGWEAVGKLIIGQRGFCTGALIEPHLVLTAAHCLFDKETGARLPIAQMEFRAGWRNGRAEAYRGVRRAVAHPDYVYGGQDKLDRVAADLALIELDRPIRLPQVLPFATDESPAVGARVGVVSYAQDREDAPSIQEVCEVLATRPGVLVLSCNVDFGSSGSPVFAMQGDVARVISVVSAKAEVDGRKVALAAPLNPPLADLRAELLAAGDARPAVSGVKVLSGGSASGGAKFLRPGG